MKGNAFAAMRPSMWGAISVVSWVYLLVVGVLFAVAFKLNTLTPYGAEDYALMLPPSAHAVGILDKAYLILARISGQFFLWNSRLGDQLAIIFLAFNKVYFNILNSLMLLILVFLLGRMSDISQNQGFKELKTAKVAGWLVTFALIILMFPALGEVFFWLTGATNYLWSIVILLSFFYRYWILTMRSPRPLSGFKFIALLLHGLLAGISNENTVPVVILLIGIVLFDIYRRDGGLRRPIWPVWGLGSLMIGYCILIFSPSTQIRLSYFKHTLAIPDPSLSLYWHRLPDIIIKWWDLFSIPMLVVFALMALLGILWRKKLLGREACKGLRLVGLFYLLSHISVGLLVFTPYVENRAFTLLFMASVVTILTLGRTLLSYPPLRPVIWAAAIVAMSASGWTLQSIYVTYESFYQEAQQRESIIVTAAANGIRDVTVHEYKAIDSRVLSTGEKWLTIKGDWHYGNKVYSEHYGVDSIKIETYLGKQCFPKVCKKSERVAGNFDVIAQDATYIHLGGWAILHDAGMDMYKIFVVLTSNAGKIYVYDTKITNRPDIIAAFSRNDYRHSGFDVLVPKQELPPGGYQLGVGLQEHGDKYGLWVAPVGGNIQI